MIKTGDESDAGTDANVYLQMFGEKGKTQNFSLREEGDKKRFERGRMDKFLIRTQDIGKVRRTQQTVFTWLDLTAATLMLPEISLLCEMSSHGKFPIVWE